MPNYPRPGKLLQAWYPTVLDVGPGQPFRRILTSTPDDLGSSDMLPTVVIGRYGGAPRVTGLDDCAIDATVYVTGPDPMRAEDIALKRCGDIQYVTETLLVGTVLTYEDPDDGEIEQGTVSRLRVISSPVNRPYDKGGRIKKAHYAFQMRLHALI